MNQVCTGKWFHGIFSVHFHSAQSVVNRCVLYTTLVHFGW